MMVKALGIRHRQSGALKSADEDIGIVQMGNIAQFFALGDFRPIGIERAGPPGILGVTVNFLRQLLRLIIPRSFLLGIIDHMHAQIRTDAAGAAFAAAAVLGKCRIHGLMPFPQQEFRIDPRRGNCPRQSLVKVTGALAVVFAINAAFFHGGKPCFMLI